MNILALTLFTFVLLIQNSSFADNSKIENLQKNKHSPLTSKTVVNLDNQLSQVQTEKKMEHAKIDQVSTFVDYIKLSTQKMNDTLGAFANKFSYFKQFKM